MFFGGVKSAPASATTCYSGGGTGYDFTISHCGSLVTTIYQMAPLFGHEQIWSKNLPSAYQNSDDTDFKTGKSWTFRFLPIGPVCVRFWAYNSPGHYISYGSIVCSIGG